MIRSILAACCLLPLFLFAQPLPTDVQTEIRGIYGPPEGTQRAPVAWLMRDIKFGKLYIKTNANNLATGWQELGAVGEAGGAGGLTNGYSFTKPLTLTGTNVSIDATAVPWTNSLGNVHIVGNTNVAFTNGVAQLGIEDSGTGSWNLKITGTSGSIKTPLSSISSVGTNFLGIGSLFGDADAVDYVGLGHLAPVFEGFLFNTKLDFANPNGNVTPRSISEFYKGSDGTAWIAMDATDSNWAQLGTGGAGVDNLWTNDLGILHPVELTNNVTIGGKLEVKTNITFNGTTPVIISGGATYGNARGAGSLDVQASHLSSQVASGAGAATVGMGNTASGAGAMAFGNGNNVSISSGTAFGQVNTVSTGSGAMAFGIGNTATGVNSMALGQSSAVSAQSAMAAGTGATSDAQFTWNITGPIMNWKSEVAKGGSSSGATGDYRYYSGVQVVLMSQELDLETTQDYTVNIAAGVHFYPDETGVIATSANTVGGQPSVSFGISGNTTKLLAATATTGLTAAFKRQRYPTLLTSEGETTLTASVTVAATATTLLGRFYWKGLLVRDQ